jgi:hypothetical protein
MKLKNLPITVIFVCMTLASRAQITKRDWILGGTFNFSNSNASPPSNASSNANISPHLGLAVGRNSVMGLSFSFGYYSNSPGQKNLSFSSNVFYRRYIVLKNKLGCYLQYNGGVALSKSTEYIFDSTGASVKSNLYGQTYNLGFTPGLYYQVTPGILLNLDAGGVAYYYSDFGHGQWASSFFVGFLNQFSFGVDFILGKKS